MGIPLYDVSHCTLETISTCLNICEIGRIEICSELELAHLKNTQTSVRVEQTSEDLHRWLEELMSMSYRMF